MGRIIPVADLQNMDVRWYMEDSYFSRDARKQQFKVMEDSAYRAHIAIHDDVITNAIRVAIRRWVEREIQDAVIVSEIDKSYRYYYGTYRDWDHCYDMRNGFTIFSFEDESSAILFKLSFGELVSDITDDHPTKHTKDIWRCGYGGQRGRNELDKEGREWG